MEGSKFSFTFSKQKKPPLPVSAISKRESKPKEEVHAAGENDNNSRTDGNFTIPLKTVISASEEPEAVNYEAIPVEKFGLAVLAGMGFNPEDLKTANTQPVGPVRPKGLGLGADPHAVEAAKQDAKTPSEEKLFWRPGARCQAVLGKHTGRYGTVNGLDGDTGRVIVKLTITKEVVPILQHMLRLVPEKEYSKFANCLNQADVDRYKSEEVNGQKNSDKVPEMDNITKRISSEQHQHDEHAYETSSKHSWVRPNLLVKFLDRHYLNGMYYKQKMTIVKVESGRCICKTSSGRLVEGRLTNCSSSQLVCLGVQPKYLQTVVPSTNNSMVMILQGPRDGEMAKLIDQNLERNEVDLRTRAGTMIQLTYDQICALADNP
ncbi:G patch domain and KOW motifs-containing protein [Paragonimus westermani]|uniref:G patch domain and KOW motifs-containing protein n=1 Tax=Paragonimus westermani TaxID=34504 RepID=A0A5J4P1E2_9TREM|nr:G patch domain and KOW motifs-containing protein [Paragonimus westermani]